MADDLKLVQKSADLLHWLFNHTEKFPKSRRFSMEEEFVAAPSGAGRPSK